MKSWFLKREYPEKLIENEMRKVKFYKEEINKTKVAKDNDKKHSRKESCMREHCFKHFNSMGHNGFLNNVSITLIDKTDGKNPKKREDYWRRTLKIYPLFGLNVEDSV